MASGSGLATRLAGRVGLSFLVTLFSPPHSEVWIGTRLYGLLARGEGLGWGLGFKDLWLRVTLYFKAIALTAQGQHRHFPDIFKVPCTD